MPDPRTQTSTTLLNRVAEGCSDAERAFFLRYAELARRILAWRGLNDADCDDVVSDTLEAAMRTLRDGRYQRGQGRFTPWFKGVLRHKLLHFQREQARDRVVRSEAEIRAPLDLDAFADRGPGPADEAEARFDQEWLRAARETAFDEIRREVEPATWQAYDLYANKGWKARAVARLLSVSTNSVYVARTRIEQRLVAKLKELAET